MFSRQCTVYARSGVTVSIVETESRRVLAPSCVRVCVLVCAQVGLLIYVSLWIARFMWRRGNDPDSYAVPYVTGLGDVSGTSALALTFWALALLYPNAGLAQTPAEAGATTPLLLAAANGTHALNATLLSF